MFNYLRMVGSIKEEEEKKSDECLYAELCFVSICGCVCVCVCTRAREREREKKTFVLDASDT